MNLSIVAAMDGNYWIADDDEFIDGPYLNLEQAERALERLSEPEDEDDDE